MRCRCRHLAAILFFTFAACAQTYKLTTGVDEVSLVFQAADFQGHALEDLALPDLRLTDNGHPPREIVSFETLTPLPLRAGLLLDISPSVGAGILQDAAIAAEFTPRLLRQPGDRVFLMRFDSEIRVLADWTGTAAPLDTALRTVVQTCDGCESRLGGTVLYDAIYLACRDQFATLRGPNTANLLLLFTDGLDNASHARLEDDVRTCQRAHTAIYAFSSGSKSRFDNGAKVLAELAAQTGGRVFFDHTPNAVNQQLQAMESNLRTQYRLVYKPDHLKPDGTFHRIKLESPTRGGVLTAPAGYYAPPKP